MGIVNTSKSIFKNLTGTAPEGMPDQEQRPQVDGPDDESSEGDPDREGNTDPGSNCPPEPPPLTEEDLFPQDAAAAAIRKAVLDEAAMKVREDALAEAANQTAPVKPDVVRAVRIQQFKYLSIGETKGMYHVTGVDSLGAPFTITEDAPVNATVFDVVEYLEGIAATK